MARVPRPVLIALAVVVAAALLVAAADAAVNCDDVDLAISPCLDYAQGTGGISAPSASCCRGVRSIVAAASRTPADRRALCNCFRASIASLGGSDDLKPVNAASIPSKCGVTLPYTISATIDCSRVS